MDHMQKLKMMLCIQLNVTVVGDGRPVRQPLFTNLSAVETKLTEMQKDLAIKIFNHRHSTVTFWRQVPESEYPDLKTSVRLIFLLSTTYCADNFFSL